MPFRIVKNLLSRSRCYYLLMSLVVLIYIYPALSGYKFAAHILGILFAATPLAGIYAVSDNRRTLVAATILGAPTILSMLWHFFSPYTLIHEEFLLVLVVLYYAFTTVAIIRHLFQMKSVDTDTILSAVSAYLMIGLTFAVWYMLMEIRTPGSFIESYGNQTIDWGDMFYYSFVTLTTLGYGDISPVTSNARSAAILEATCGVLYMSTLIARLVSEYRNHPRSGD
jgi:hypothetical protein